MLPLLMLALLLQVPPMQPNFDTINITPGTDLTLNFKGFSADDMVSIRQMDNPNPRMAFVTVASNLIKDGELQNIKAATVQRSGNTLTVTPASDGPRLIVVMIGPSTPVHITQDGVTIPFSGKLFIEGNDHSEDLLEFQRRLLGKVKIPTDGSGRRPLTTTIIASPPPLPPPTQKE